MIRIPELRPIPRQMTRTIAELRTFAEDTTGPDAGTGAQS